MYSQSLFLTLLFFYCALHFFKRRIGWFSIWGASGANPRVVSKTYRILSSSSDQSYYLSDGEPLSNIYHIYIYIYIIYIYIYIVKSENNKTASQHITTSTDQFYCNIYIYMYVYHPIIFKNSVQKTSKFPHHPSPHHPIPI